MHWRVTGGTTTALNVKERLERKVGRVVAAMPWTGPWSSGWLATVDLEAVCF